MFYPKNFDVVDALGIYSYVIFYFFFESVEIGFLVDKLGTLHQVAESSFQLRLVEFGGLVLDKILQLRLAPLFHSF